MTMNVWVKSKQSNTEEDKLIPFAMEELQAQKMKPVRGTG